MKKLLGAFIASCIFFSTVYPQSFLATGTTVSKEVFNHRNYQNIQVQKMWEAGFKGEGVNVAVLDTGIVEHPALSDSQLERSFYCYAWRPFLKKCINDSSKSIDSLGHGTHVTGIISSTHKEIGIAPASTVYSFKVVGENDKSNQPNKNKVLHALEYIHAHNKDAPDKDRIHIVNMSFRMEKDLRVEKIINKMYKEQNVLFVAAVSNTGTVDPTENVAIKDAEYLHSLPNVIGVGNVTHEFKRFAGTNKGGGSYVGEGVDLSAPGTDIISTFPLELDNESHFLDVCQKTMPRHEKCLESMWDGTEDGYKKSTGTSMATAVVTGYLALLKNQYPNCTNDELRMVLLSNTVPRPGETDVSYGDLEYGSGVMQAVPHGAKYLIEAKWDTFFYDIPVEDSAFYYNPSLSTNDLEVHLEWTDFSTEDNTRWLKVKLEDDLFKWVLLDEVSKWEDPIFLLK